MKSAVAAKTTLIVLLLCAFVLLAYAALLRVSGNSERELLAVLISGAATIFAGWLAWESAVAENARTEAEKVDRAAARKLDAVVVISQPVHAAAAWLAKLSADISSQGDRDGKSLRAKRYARQLDEVLDRDLALALLNDMSADDRINLLMIVGTMRTAIAMAEVDSTRDTLASDDLALIRNALSGLGTHLARFDRDLSDTFLRDSGQIPTHPP